MYLVAVFVIVAVYYLILYLKWKKNIYNYMEKLPGIARVPIVGTEYIFIGVPREELFTVMMEHFNKYGPLFRVWNGSNPEVHTVKPEHFELIMHNSIHITKGQQYDYLHLWLGEGLLTSTGTRWHHHRKLITPTFHFKVLENFMEVFVEKTETLLKILDSKADDKAWNIYKDITHCALDIICETSMGVSVNVMSDENNNYIKSVYDISELLLWRLLRPYIPTFIFNMLPQGRRFNKHLKVLHGFSKKIIAERKELLRKKSRSDDNKIINEDEALGKKERMCFLDLLLEASEDAEILSDSDIREEVDTFMFEGHDTTTAGMSWSLLLLGNHPAIQEKVFEEVRDVLQGKSTPTSIAELHELKYLECVIKEALRLYPSVPFISRKLEEEITLDGNIIPAGVYVVLNIYGVHRNPLHYPNPDKFDPDRFLPENSRGRHPYAYVPFSAGPRNCIGQKFAIYEEKTILASIIRRYKVKAMESLEDVKISADLILKPINGVVVKLEKRAD